MIIKINLESVKDDELEYTVLEYEENGETITDKHTYSAEKVDEDFSKAIIGSWQGQAEDGKPVENRINFKADNVYTYSTKVGEEWVEDEKGGAKYWLYGDILVTEFNDPLSTTTPARRLCEIWDIDIENGKIKFEAKMQVEDQIKDLEFELKKVIE